MVDNTIFKSIAIVFIQICSVLCITESLFVGHCHVPTDFDRTLYQYLLLQFFSPRSWPCHATMLNMWHQS